MPQYAPSGSGHVVLLRLEILVSEQLSFPEERNEVIDALNSAGIQPFLRCYLREHLCAELFERAKLKVVKVEE